MYKAVLFPPNPLSVLANEFPLNISFPLVPMALFTFITLSAFITVVPVLISTLAVTPSKSANILYVLSTITP